MGLFGKLFEKKKEDAPAKEDSSPVVSFGIEFDPDEISVLVVTGPTAFQSAPDQATGLYKLHMPISAWLEDGTEEIHRGNLALLALGNETLRDYLRQRTPSDFIIKCKARPSTDGNALLLTNLPEPGFDPDLKAILDEQKTPVSTWVDGLGTFTLNRSINTFQAEVEWLGQPVLISFDQTEDEAACIRTAQAVMADQSDLDEKARALAADQLLEYINSSADEDCEAVEREEFVSRICVSNIIVTESGSFQLFLEDDELLWGRAIQVSGSLETGITDAAMEG